MLSKYLKILSESLDEKIRLLSEIELKSNEQSNMIENKATFEDIDKNMDEKAELIEKINKMDEGFQALYDNLREELKNKQGEHASEIDIMKKKISDVMRLSSSIQAVEARNKMAMETRFASAHKNNSKRLVSVSAVNDYYKMANKLNAVPPQFMDKKN